MEVRKYLNVSSDMFVVREEVYQQKKAVLQAVPARPIATARPG